MARSKSYIADKFFPPIQLKSNDLITLFANGAWREWEQETDAYLAWREDLFLLLPKLGVDALIELVYYLSFEGKLNDKRVWSAVEDAALASIHLFDLQRSCQMQWATNQLKPRHVSNRFGTMLFKQAMDKVD